MSDVRDVFFQPADRAVIRTADVYQTEIESGVEGYSDTLLSVVANFHNSGRPEGFNAQSMVGKSKRGEVALRIFAIIDPETETIEKAGFKSRGCLAMTAAASTICSMVEGKTFPEALAITEEDIRAALDGVPWDKSYTLTFAVEAVRALYGDWLQRTGATLAQLDELVPCNAYAPSCLVCEHCSLRNSRTDLMVEDLVATQKANDSFAPEIAAAAVLPTVSAKEQQSDAAADSVASDAETQDAPDPEPTAQQKELTEHNAIALLLQEVRRASADSQLSRPEDWPQFEFFPAHLTSEEFEMLVYEYLEAEGDPHDIPAAVGRGQKAPENPHVISRFRTAKSTVGVPKIFSHVGEKGPDNAAADTLSAATDEPLIESVLPEQPLPTGARAGYVTDPETGLQIPAGYHLQELEGELVLVPDSEGEGDQPLEIDCDGIRALVGRHSYYLYDRTHMTDAFARWAFLAAENDPVVTLAELTREECRTYPRPLAASALSNDPFHMSAEDIARAFQQMEGLEDFSDIGQVTNSANQTYYYSRDLMSENMARSLAEFYGVERPASV